ncbi:MAG: hypothetical protein QOD06_1869 [Candidatus Binatota bacterium]|jgi:predicted AlkP superfamily phosphohydrolase/phosphomutase/Flp pilus assembly protein TadD|nr:hypothetical protein [Candidatus Binatota bacterium]
MLRPSRALIALAALLLTVGCRSGAQPGKVIILGLDGMDPRAVDLLMSEGKLPSFARMRQEGAYGRLESSEPMLSPILWTTIATGKLPTEHGIGHFVTVNQQTGEQLPVTSQMRRVKALWNVLSEHDRKVGVVGWWATWPAESVNGAIVSDHTLYHFLLEKSRLKEQGGKTYPPDLENEIAPLIRAPEDLTAEEVAPFVHVPPEDLARPFTFENDLSHFKWALAAADSHRRIGLHLWDRLRPDALFVYVEGTDSVAHLFGHLFRAHGLSGELAEQQKRYGDAVEQMYVHADGIVRDFMNALDDDTTLIVLSDHGFELGALQDDPSKTRDMRRVSEKFHHRQGILYLYGKNVRRRAVIETPALVDIAPTVLALVGLAPAEDMPGRVLEEAVDVTRRPAVTTYETGTAVARGNRSDSSVDPAILQRLQSLGYVNTRSTTGERNLAAVHFQAGRYEQAAKAYAALLSESPKDGSLRTSLAGALGALGKYDEALAELGKAIELEPLNPEAYHNRAVIHERRGEREQAIRDYRTAVRYNPQYAPSRQALKRLTGSEAVFEPRTDPERLAAALADRASEDARRGDYAAAMKKLDEAERIAPRFVLVQQYRANVAYLKGDRQAAIAALEKALAVEPDNALYKSNLERLQKEAREASADDSSTKPRPDAPANARRDRRSNTAALTPPPAPPP